MVFSANNQALKHKRKTLTANDVFEALEDMEFESFIEPLKESLECKCLFFFDIESSLNILLIKSHLIGISNCVLCFFVSYSFILLDS